MSAPGVFPLADLLESLTTVSYYGTTLSHASSSDSSPSPPPRSHTVPPSGDDRRARVRERGHLRFFVVVQELARQLFRRDESL